jgi:hypothetical protein
VSYDPSHEAGKDAQKSSYDHDLPGFVRPSRNADREQAPDVVQRSALANLIAYVDKKVQP